jgi:hypothetical protein
MIMIGGDPMILTDTKHEHRRRNHTHREEPTKWLIPISRAYEFIEIPASEISDDIARHIRAVGPFKALQRWRGIPIEWTDGGALRLA